jgi:hypothetical protein
MTWRYDEEIKRHLSSIFEIEEYGEYFRLYQKSIFQNSPPKLIGVFLKLSSAKKVAHLLING